MNGRTRFGFVPRAFLLLGIVAAFAHGIALPAFAEGAATVSEKDAANLLLQDLDSQFARLEKFQDSAPTREERAATEKRLAGLKDRRQDLRIKFDQGHYEALKNDVSAEYARLSKYITNASGAPNATESEGETVDAVLKVKTESIPTKPGDGKRSPQIKALLVSLETEIAELEQRVIQMPVSTERDAAKQRVQLFRDQSLALANDFDAARYEALRNEVKSEWRTMTR